jgi:hypothetical protein
LDAKGKFYKESEVCAHSERRDFVSSYYVWNKYLYFAVAQLVEALRYMPEGHGLVSR